MFNGFRFSSVILLLAGLALIGTAIHRDRSSAQPVYIAIASAFAAEQDTLRAQLEAPTTHTIGSLTLLTGRLADHDVILFLTGESMINAAMNIQRALDHFNIRAVIFVGIAGSLDPELTVGDVVIPEEWVQYQESVYLREADSGNLERPEWLAAAPAACGITAVKPVKLMTGQSVNTFAADAALLGIARQLDGVHVGGVGASGQAYLANRDYAACLFDTVGARIVDMESAAAAHVAASSNLPFIAVRAVSDIVGESYAQAVENRAQIEIGMQRAAQTVITLLESLP